MEIFLNYGCILELPAEFTKHANGQASLLEIVEWSLDILGYVIRVKNQCSIGCYLNVFFGCNILHMKNS